MRLFLMGLLTSLAITAGAQTSSTNAQDQPMVAQSPNGKIKYAIDYAPANPQKPWPAWDFSLFVQGGNGLEDRTSYHFLSAGAYLGRILTDDHTSLHANFEYGVEVLPLWQSYTPTFQKINCPYNAASTAQCSSPTTSGGTYRGISIVPISLRINMNSGAMHWRPWIQGAGGLIYTTRKYPGIGSTNAADPSQTAPNADTSVWNFDPQFGIGTHYFLRSTRSVDISANAVHISSASLGDKNPGVNTGVQFTLGYSWWK